MLSVRIQRTLAHKALTQRYFSFSKSYVAFQRRYRAKRYQHKCVFKILKNRAGKMMPPWTIVSITFDRQHPQKSYRHCQKAVSLIQNFKNVHHIAVALTIQKLLPSKVNLFFKPRTEPPFSVQRLKIYFQKTSGGPSHPTWLDDSSQDRIEIYL